ncbi:hypothetical protein AVEN_183421-1 [Araneus ventricosus]|uniref:Uncharacterized protein n=1 Tax=Araneus ventricosus TaxID=182803 RepID=A0A4Y2Q1Y3_ARAVE|nr:hypothetical protein AVEN_183421-1 [Araneus ventricosus]
MAVGLIISKGTYAPVRQTVRDPLASSLFASVDGDFSSTRVANEILIGFQRQLANASKYGENANIYKITAVGIWFGQNVGAEHEKPLICKRNFFRSQDETRRHKLNRLHLYGLYARISFICIPLAVGLSMQGETWWVNISFGEVQCGAKFYSQMSQDSVWSQLTDASKYGKDSGIRIRILGSKGNEVQAVG